MALVSSHLACGFLYSQVGTGSLSQPLVSFIVTLVLALHRW
jgi:hypothetical protein